MNGADSRWSQVTSEWCRLKVVIGYKWNLQGSVLGPLLFLLFVSDMPDDIMSSVKAFADDTKAFNDV